MRVSEIRVKRIHVNQGLGVHLKFKSQILLECNCYESNKTSGKNA